MKARFKIKEKDYVIRMAVILSALLAPYFCIFFAGFQQSLSAYWNTDMQPVFIFANAATSYYLFSIPNWRTSALCLLLVTAFSVDAYELTHNI